MNHVPLILSVGTVLALSTLFAYAQTSANEDGIRFVYAQSIIRNAHGQLISYLETFRIGLNDVERLNSVASYEVNFGKKEFVVTEIDGISHQWIKVDRPSTFDAKTVRSTTILGDVIDGKPVSFASFANDGYNIDAGDVLTVRWTIARPVQ
jgi:hypothetical protein